MVTNKKQFGLQARQRGFVPRNLLTVYLDGELIGSLEEGGGNVLARDSDGHIIGTFGEIPRRLRRRTFGVIEW
jgi:hypothetical protein